MNTGFGFTPACSTYDAAAHLAANSARSAARRAATDVAIMQGEIERLLMITEALWGMLKEQNAFDDDELVRRITEIDLRDGKLDGRVSKKEEPRRCPTCNRVLSKKRPLCIYCGTAVRTAPFGR